MEFHRITRTLDLSPMPIMTIKTGNIEIDGILLMTFMIGIISSLAKSFIDVIKAMGTPMITARDIPNMTIFNVLNKFK